MAAVLVISAPHNKVDTETPSFGQIVATGVAPGYAIPKDDRSKIGTGSKLIIVDNISGKRAEAVIKSLDPAEKTDAGMQRFDVHFHDPALKDLQVREDQPVGHFRY